MKFMKMISSAIMELADVIFHSVVSKVFGPEFTVHPEQKEAVFSLLCALSKGHYGRPSHWPWCIVSPSAVHGWAAESLRTSHLGGAPAACTDGGSSQSAGKNWCRGEPSVFCLCVKKRLRTSFKVSFCFLTSHVTLLFHHILHDWLHQ